MSNALTISYRHVTEESRVLCPIQHLIPFLNIVLVSFHYEAYRRYQIKMF